MVSNKILLIINNLYYQKFIRTNFNYRREEERTLEPKKELEKFQFTRRYFLRFMKEKNLDFSTAKSDQKAFNEEEIENFKSGINILLAAYQAENILNMVSVANLK